ncbi:ribonuclease H-like domain-containing protein [Tanacetum coccineum]
MSSEPNYQWEDLLDIDDSDLPLTPVLRPCNRHVRETITITSTQNTDGIVQVEEVEEKPVRIIPGPAGIVQLAKIRKQSDIHEGADDSVLSTQEYMKQVVEDVGEDEDFNSGSWVGATEYVKANGGIVSGCLGDIKTFLKNGKLEQVVAIIKSCSPNALGDLKVTVKDLSAEGGGALGELGANKAITHHVIAIVLYPIGVVEAACALEVDAMGALDLVEVEAVGALDLVEVGAVRALNLVEVGAVGSSSSSSSLEI